MQATQQQQWEEREEMSTNLPSTLLSVLLALICRMSVKNRSVIYTSNPFLLFLQGTRQQQWEEREEMSTNLPSTLWVISL